MCCPLLSIYASHHIHHLTPLSIQQYEHTNDLLIYYSVIGTHCPTTAEVHFTIVMYLYCERAEWSKNAAVVIACWSKVLECDKNPQLYNVHVYYQDLLLSVKSP